MRKTNLNADQICLIINAGNDPWPRRDWVRELILLLKEGDPKAEAALLRFLYSFDADEKTVVYQALKRLSAPASETLIALKAFENNPANRQFIALQQ